MRKLRFSTLLFLLLFLFFPQNDALGQGPADAPASIEALPSWAEPMTPDRADAPRMRMDEAPGTDEASLPPASRVPVDGGLIWLLAAGGALGVHRLRDATRAKS